MKPVGSVDYSSMEKKLDKLPRKLFSTKFGPKNYLSIRNYRANSSFGHTLRTPRLGDRPNFAGPLPRSLPRFSRTPASQWHSRSLLLPPSPSLDHIWRSLFAVHLDTDQGQQQKRRRSWPEDKRSIGTRISGFRRCGAR